MNNKKNLKNNPIRRPRQITTSKVREDLGSARKGQGRGTTATTIISIPTKTSSSQKKSLRPHDSEASDTAVAPFDADVEDQQVKDNLKKDEGESNQPRETISHGSKGATQEMKNDALKKSSEHITKKKKLEEEIAFAKDSKIAELQRSPQEKKDKEEVTRFAQDLVSAGFWQSCSLEAAHGPAEWKCLHCGDYMCSSCTNLHKRGKKSRQHCILHKSRQLDEDSIRKDLFCSRHDGREKEKYCKTDKKKICEKCETESHSHHDVVSLSNMAGEERSHVGKCLDQVDKSIPKYTKIFERLDNYIAETKNQAVENCRIIDEAVEDVISMVKTRGMQLKNEENARFSLELRENVVKKRYDLELDMQRMKKTLFESRKFLETSNDIELIDGASNYIEKLSSLRQPDYEKVDKELLPVTRISVQHVREQLEGLEIKEMKHEGSRK